jgi:hypothetical protein
MPQSIVKAVGKQWDGQYIIHELNAREYLQAQSAATSFMIQEYLIENTGKPENEQDKWNGIIPEDVMTLHIVCKSVTLNGIQLDPKIPPPAKIYEPLAWKTLPANTISKDEFEALFLSSQPNNHAQSQSKST